MAFDKLFGKKSFSLTKALSFFLFLFLITAFNSPGFFEISLKNLENKTQQFSDYKKYKATIVIFLLSDCPASQSYTLTLNNLSRKYSGENIAIVGVFPGKFSTDEELFQFKTEYKISYPLLKDPEMILVKKLEATVAPECFVINNSGNTIYKGRIDDWLYSLGKKRQIITENNLEDAIKAVIRNKPVKISETKPIGCILEYEK